MVVERILQGRSGTAALLYLVLIVETVRSRMCIVVMFYLLAVAHDSRMFMMSRRGR